jgi:hypothetical protein
MFGLFKKKDEKRPAYNSGTKRRQQRAKQKEAAAKKRASAASSTPSKAEPSMRQKERARRQAAATKRVKSVQAKSAAAKAPKRSKFGVGSAKTITHKGRKMANVDASQLKATGMTLRAYMNAWNKTGKRPTKKK